MPSAREAEEDPEKSKAAPKKWEYFRETDQPQISKADIKHIPQYRRNKAFNEVIFSEFN